MNTWKAVSWLGVCWGFAPWLPPHPYRLSLLVSPRCWAVCALLTGWPSSRSSRLSPRLWLTGAENDFGVSGWRVGEALGAPALVGSWALSGGGMWKRWKGASSSVQLSRGAGVLQWTPWAGFST